MCVFVCVLSIRAAETSQDIESLRPPRFIHEDGVIRPYKELEGLGSQMLQVCPLFLPLLLVTHWYLHLKQTKYNLALARNISSSKRKSFMWMTAKVKGGTFGVSHTFGLCACEKLNLFSLTSSMSLMCHCIISLFSSSLLLTPLQPRNYSWAILERGTFRFMALIQQFVSQSSASVGH